ncbi:hypothetical protein D0437_29660 [Bacillus cereus]|uniref:Cas12f1-like TNB domain-containing protein n=1 Tax=Bacillus cereus TaxID=1396 RepID=A0A9X7QNH1_BACCE|nr:hypothetical protein D0437_29660 [Bacillus cereus]
MAQFQIMLKYKEKWYRKRVIIVTKTFAFSQICPCCSVYHDDDASITLRNEAIRLSSLLNAVKVREVHCLCVGLRK